jgi:hypothetical protein
MLLTSLKGEKKMKDLTETQIAWEIWNLIARLNDLIWDRYEEEFIELYLNKEEEKHWETINKQHDEHMDLDF